jgi:hypothetical protein
MTTEPTILDRVAAGEPLAVEGCMVKYGGLVVYEMITGFPPDSFPSLGPRGQEVGRSSTLQSLNQLVLEACDLQSHRGFENAQEMVARLEALLSQRHHTVRRTLRVSAVGATGCLLLGLLAALGWRWWSNPLPRTYVNFITEPYEATICMDGTVLTKPDGTSYTTPCTVPDLTAKIHHVVFQHTGLEDLDLGSVDFAETPEITARWESPP